MASTMHLLWIFIALVSAIYLQKVVDIVDQPYLVSPKTCEAISDSKLGLNKDNHLG